MADDLTLIGLEGGFTFDIEGRRHCGRIGPAFCDGVAEKLENIVVLPTVEATRAILCLTGSIKMQAAAVNNRHDPDQPIPQQALVHQNV
jgi:hypothetical protein